MIFTCCKLEEHKLSLLEWDIRLDNSGILLLSMVALSISSIGLGFARGYLTIGSIDWLLKALGCTILSLVGCYGKALGSAILSFNEDS